MKQCAESLKILYEDNHLIAADKPHGMPVQNDKTKDRSLIDCVKDYLKTKYQKPGNVFLGCVHRIDRPAGGIVVFAKTSKALSRLNASMKAQTIKRFYTAVTEAMLAKEQGTLIHFLSRDRQKNISYAFEKKTSEIHAAKKGITYYKLSAKEQKKFLWEVRIETGRHHQIRAQFSAAGAPLLGDVKYGAKDQGSRSSRTVHIALYAHKLILTHPVKKTEIIIESPVPDAALWHPWGIKNRT